MMIQITNHVIDVLILVFTTDHVVRRSRDTIIM